MKDIKHFSELNYERPDFAQLQSRLDEFAERISGAEDFETYERAIYEFCEWNKNLDEMQVIALIRMYLDCTDTFYAQEYPELAGAVEMLDKEKVNQNILASRFSDRFGEKVGSYYLALLKRNIRLFSKGKELQAKEQELMSEYQQLEAGMKFDWEGTAIGDNKLEKFRRSQDRAQRREAYHATYQAYAAQSEKMGDILKSLIALRNQIAEANGFSCYIDYKNEAMGRLGYGEKEIDEFTELVKREVVPYWAQVLEQKRKRLGLDTLKYYDGAVYFEDKEPQPKSVRTMLKSASGMFHQIDEELGSMYDAMLEHGYIDILPSENKITGMGFNVTLPVSGISYIFGNVSENFHDVTVLTHEFGHAIQGYYTSEHQNLTEYQEMCNDAVEIPSKTMELLTYDFAESFFGEDADKFILRHAVNFLEEIVVFCRWNEFENWMYRNPEASISELSDKYMELEKAYMPGVDYSEMTKEMETGLLVRCKSLFLFPKYVISYALSDVSALHLAKRWKSDRERAWKNYRTLCGLGGSLPYKELLQKADLRAAYEEETVRGAMEYIKSFVSLS